jgi:hypothetical protein
LIAIGPRLFVQEAECVADFMGGNAGVRAADYRAQADRLAATHAAKI